MFEIFSARKVVIKEAKKALEILNVFSLTKRRFLIVVLIAKKTAKTETDEKSAGNSKIVNKARKIGIDAEH